MIWTTEKLNTFLAMKDQGYTLKEIAAELGCTYAAAQNKSHEIKKQKKESTKMENSEKNVGTVETPTDHIAEAGKKVSSEDILDRAKASAKSSTASRRTTSRLSPNSGARTPGISFRRSTSP